MQIRTDLAMESRENARAASGVVTRKLRQGDIEEIYVSIETEEGAQALGKPRGRYITCCHPQLAHASSETQRRLARMLAAEIGALLPPFGDVLVIGLGNRRITADALGSHVLESLLITRHMKDVTPDELTGRLRGVCAIAPGVLGVTGMETAEMVLGITQRVRPAAVIAIDALAARESGRICTTIQVTDTGIRPGSGVGNHRMEISRETLGVPVIAIGVPMVVYAAVIARDALSLLVRDMGLSEEEHAQAMDALVTKVTAEGLGELVVTPREVDEMVGRVAQIIALGINIALQKRLSEEEILLLSHDGL
ncbi:MAG: GPR endopeptidase [Clostridiales bacterium]|nr:GPR endopeptidase [Clostridiales bacterium]